MQEQQLQSMQGVKGLLAAKDPVRAGCDMAWDDEKAVPGLPDTMTVVVGIQARHARWLHGR